MSEKYDHKSIEKKWQAEWESAGMYQADNSSNKPKKYVLDMFPYPSGEGLHVGHPKGYIATDVYSRMKRMQGFNVLHPMGWDAFGLPAEQYAIKNKVHPRVAVEKNVARYKEQLSSIGFDYDWTREINTTNPAFYKWTQWIFLKMFEKGLAYESYEPINWCTTCLTGLANEDLEDGRCERCDTLVEQKPMRQWVLRITKYADRMLEGLEKLNWPTSIKESQKNWIGRSEGAEIDFAITTRKKNKYVILHGYKSAADRPRWKWIKYELEKRGHEVIIPQLPNSENPSEEEQVATALAATTYDEDTILVGHSLGAVVAMKALQKLNRKVAGLILIAAAIEPKFHDAAERPFWKTFSWDDVDYQKLQTLAVFRTVLSDLKEFKTRVEYLKHLSSQLNAQLIETYAEKEHFSGDVEPKILSLLSPDVTVFTTRPDTLFGATYCVLAPEHSLVGELKDSISNWKEVDAYLIEVKTRTEIERAAVGREKTGVELKGVKVVNPANNEELPLFVADYVLGNYGTGAVMAVPAHDERDFEFAKKFGLPIKKVIEPVTGEKKENEEFRKSIVALVEDPKTGNILSLNWCTLGGNLLIGGGIDGEEDLVACAKREIQEETGYENLEFVAMTEKIHHHYVAISKGVNRNIEAVGLYFKLLGNEKSGTALEENEKGKFKVEWVSKNNLGGLIKDSLHKLVFDRFIHDRIFYGDGILFSSGKFDGKESEVAKKEITDFVKGRWVTKYKLKDWVFSRQRYWGEPIPLIHCEECGVVPVPEKDLPVVLPQVESYEPTGTGESPLAGISEWVNVSCPRCGGKGKRETNTMPQWAGSSWYYLRYIDPRNTEVLVDKEKEKYWSPVDMYVGGAEHATRHLIYARFYHKFLFDIGVVNYEEPFSRLQNVGLIMAEDGRKMSKRWGNIVNPDDIVSEYGADTLRLYEMFMGPFGQAIAWDTKSIIGPRRFLERVWKLKEKVSGTAVLKDEAIIHKTIQKVGEDIEEFSFNTAISSMMILVNELEKFEVVSKEAYETLLLLLAPFAPHITEELWHEIGNNESIHLAKWSVFDASKCVASEVTIAIQVGGKLRDTIVVPADAGEEAIKELAIARPAVVKWVDGNTIKKIIYVKGRLINIVVG